MTFQFKFVQSKRYFYILIEDRKRSESVYVVGTSLIPQQIMKTTFFTVCDVI